MNDFRNARRSKSAGRIALPMSAILSLVLVSLVANLLMLTGPLFMLQIYDRVLASGSLPTLIVLTLLVCCLYGFFAFLDAMRGRIALRLAHMVDMGLNKRLFEASVRSKLLGAKTSFNPTRDGDQLRQFLTSPGPITLLDLPWVPLYIGVVFLFHPTLGWLAVAGALIVTALMVCNEILSKKAAELAAREQVNRQEMVEEARQNAETIVAMGMLQNLQPQWSLKSNQYLVAQQAASDRNGFFSSVTKAFRFLLQSGVLALGAFLVLQNQLSPGLMIAASIVTSRALAPIDQAVAHWRSFSGARQAFDRIRQIWEVSLTREQQTELPLPKKSLSVQKVQVNPPGSKTIVLQGIDFTLEAGDGLGVLGPSGAGKSTLAKSLAFVWSTTSGDVRVDGASIAHYSEAQRASFIGYLPQRVELMSGTIAQNISRFEPNPESEKVIAAAKAAHVHELICSFDNGYETEVGENANLLSAGQAQRIGLARAIYDEPFLLVLDEPNSNLDSDGDIALSEAIQGARDRGAIVIVIAHRPSAIVAANKLLFVQRGRQIAFGLKDEVLAQISQNSGGNVRAMKAGQ